MANRFSRALRLFGRRRQANESEAAQVQREGQQEASGVKDSGHGRARGGSGGGKRRDARRHARLSWRRPVTAFDWLSYASRDQGLRLLRRNQIHVDTTIVTSDGFTDRVHWQVLVALCPELVEASELIVGNQLNATQYKLLLPDHIKGTMALLLIECAYGEPILSLDSTNLEQFYDIATEYHIDHALKICLDFARTILNVNNCIYLHRLSLRHNHRRLRRASYSMIRSNFKLILHVNKDFHLLDANQLKQLLLDNLLKLNDDEEIAWLAIFRWQRRRLLTPRELASVYNQIVSGHHDVQLIHWPAPVNQLQLMPAAGPNQEVAEAPQRRPLVGDGSASRQPQSSNTVLPRLPLRLTLDFYSPVNPIETSVSSPLAAAQLRRSGSNTSRQKRNSSPLRRAAERAFRSGRLEDDCRLEQTEEAQLYSLVKCLRFMRFRSVAAFDTIQECDFIQASETLTRLVGHMRVAYKLHHGLALSQADQRDISLKQLKRYRVYNKSRAERLLETFVKLMGLQRAVGSGGGVGDHERNGNRLGCGTREQQQERANMAGLPLEEMRSPEVVLHKRRRIDANEEAKANRPTAPGRPTLMDNDNDDYDDDLQLLGQRSLERAEKPRVPISVGLLIGGWQDGNVRKSIWAYDFVSDKWFKLNIKLPEARAFHASCSSPTKGHIYIFGGTNGEAILDSVLKLNLATDVYINNSNRASKRDATSQASSSGGKSSPLAAMPRLEYKFKQLHPMNERRCHLSGVFHSDGRLYALGGHNGSQRLRSGEWYDPNSNQWHPIAEMTIARADAAACSHDNKIFIAGGQISDQYIQASVEFYKSSDNTWTFAAPMIIPRMSFCMASYKGQLLAIGGTNGLFGGEEVASVTRTVERYNHSAGNWSFCAPMITKRCSFGAMQIGNKLLVMGGHSGRRRLKTCESLRIGQFNGQSISSLLALSRAIQTRLQRPQHGASNQQARVAAATMTMTQTAISGGVGAAKEISNLPPESIMSRGAPQQSSSYDENTTNRPTDSNSNNENNSDPIPSGSATAATANELLASIARGQGQQTHPRSAMKWIPMSKLPERRSGFSVVAVHKLKNAKDFTYYGSLKQPKVRPQPEAQKSATTATTTTSTTRVYTRPSFIKQPGRWHKFKIIKRRKLVKHLKIALIVTIVILMI